MAVPHFLAGLMAVSTVGVLSVASTIETTPTVVPACTLAHPQLARGFSLTGWFDEPGGRMPDAAVLKALKARGLDHVRLPIAAETVMTRFTSATAVEARRRDIEAAIDALIAGGYAVVVDLHGGDRLEKLFAHDPVAARDAVIQAWTVLGPMIERRAGRKVMAEVLNEPPLDDAVWIPMQTGIVAAMRKTMPKTTLVISTGGPQRVERLTAVKPIADRNTVYAVHYYDPMIFTHQGAGWIRPDPIAWLRGVPFPIAADDPRMAALATSLRKAGLDRVADYLVSLRHRSFAVADIRRDMQALGAWSRAHGRPVVIGEFGVYRPVVNSIHRRVWLNAVTKAAADECLGWTHWEYRDGFGLVDTKTERPDEATLSALAGLRPPTAEPPPQLAGTPPTAGAVNRSGDAQTPRP